MKKNMGGGGPEEKTKCGMRMCESTYVTLVLIMEIKV